MIYKTQNSIINNSFCLTFLNFIPDFYQLDSVLALKSFCPLLICTLNFSILTS